MDASSMRAGEFKFSHIYHRGLEPLTIVMIHGLGGSKEYLTGILNYPNLAKYSVLIPDLVGFGDTPARKGFSYKMVDQARAMGQLMEALNIGGDVVLIPHSMGGPIGLMLAEMLGGRVKGIVWCEGNVDFGDCFASGQIIKSSLEDWVATGFNRMLEGASVPAEPFRKAGPLSLYLSSVDLVEVSEEDTIVGRLKKLGVPVLAVYGEQNRGRWESERKLGTLFPLVFIPEAGHGMMTDNPDAFYRVVAHFISQLK